MYSMRKPVFISACLAILAIGFGCVTTWADERADQRRIGRNVSSAKESVQPVGDFSGVPHKTQRAKERGFRNPVAAGAVTVTILGFLALGIFLIAGKIRQPYSITVEPVDPPELSNFMTLNSEKLLSMGFTHRLDFTIPELPHKGFFRLFGTKLNERAVILHELQSGSAAKLNKQFVNYIEFRTFLDNGIRVCTNNLRQRAGLKPKPDYVIIRHPGVQDVEELYNRHRADVDHAKITHRGRIVAQPLDRFPEQFAEDWEALMRYEVEQGALKKSEDAGMVRGTPMTVLRAISPTEESGPMAWAGALVGAVMLLTLILLIPTLDESLGFKGGVAFNARTETIAILVITLVVGFVVGSGGVLTGLLVYLPSIIIVETGPLGYLMPIALAYTSGTVGEKLRRLPDSGTMPFYKFLSPELYLVILLGIGPFFFY